MVATSFKITVDASQAEAKLILNALDMALDVTTDENEPAHADLAAAREVVVGRHGNRLNGLFTVGPEALDFIVTAIEMMIDWSHEPDMDQARRDEVPMLTEIMKSLAGALAKARS